jgi:hypothetical protein
MADNNLEGQFKHLLNRLQSEQWREFWEELALATPEFEDLGLARDASDAVVWQTCQDHEIVLFTANRNDEGPDSLEATIRRFNQASSLPVITLGDSERFSQDREYAERVVIRLLEILLDLDPYRGTGRLYLP